MHCRTIWKFRAYALCAALLTGCAGVPPEQLAKMATVEVAAGYTLHSVDSEVKLFSDSVSVEPGTHVFEMTMTCYNNNCIHQAYRFNAVAGYLYRIMPDRTVLVLDRNDRYQRKLDELTPIGGINYGTRKQSRQVAEEMTRRQEMAREAVLERRRQNLPLVRKLGAKICRVQTEYLYIGFVEAFNDEKIQVRVAEARINENRNLVLTNFTPSIIWDSPLNWDLCE